MKKCHVSAFAVTVASALVSAAAIAGPPQFPNQFSPSFHKQLPPSSRYHFNYLIKTVEFRGCEFRTDGYLCQEVGAANYTFGLVVSVNESEETGAVIANRYMYCELSSDSLDIAADARGVRFEVEIDIAADGCYTYGFTVDRSTWEYGPSEFPNSMSIRALFSDPWATRSTIENGHYSTADGARENLTCDNDTGEYFQDASVEINGSSVPIDWSRAYTNRCNTVGR